MKKLPVVMDDFKEILDNSNRFVDWRAERTPITESWQVGKYTQTV